jgi:hypothetical protein
MSFMLSKYSYLFIYQIKNDFVVCCCYFRSGKSHFAYYVIWKYLQREDSKGKRIIFQRNPDDFLEFTDQFVRKLNTRDIINIQDDENNVFFADLVDKNDAFFATKGITIVFSSPDKRRYHEYFKLRPEPITLVLNPLLWEDTNDLMSRLILESKANNVDLKWNKSDVEKNFILIGGVPRFIFVPHEKCNNIIENALKEKAIPIYQNVALNGLNKLSGTDENISYRILNMRSDDNIEPYFCFATDEIAVRLMAKFSYYNGTDTIRSILYNTISPRTKGDYFQIIGHAMFMRRVEGYSNKYDSITLTEQYQQYEFSEKCKSLSEKYESIDLNPLLKYDSFAFYIKSEISLKKKCYYKLYNNFESIDSFTIIDNNVYFFQFTTAKVHPVSAFGIQIIYDNISECFKNEKFTFNLIFIGIEADDNLISFKMQRINKIKELSNSEIAKLKAGSFSDVTKSANSPNYSFVTSNLSIDINQMKWGIILRNPNDIILCKG